MVPASPVSRTTKVVIVTTVMLTFISFWRASAIVLSDLASTAYYIGGIAQESIGRAAPWFILMVMLFSYAVRAVYVESCSMFTRGGVYRIVKEAMGSTMAKIGVSALMFDYALTGPISSVSAGQYLYGLVENTMHLLGYRFLMEPNAFSVIFALSVTSYFWWLNIKGIEESSDKALKIMIVTTVMVVTIIVWSLVTMWFKHAAPAETLTAYGLEPGLHLPPIHPELTRDSLGWLAGIPWMKTMWLAVLMVAFGHSILAMSGEETLAQVYREIEAPKHKNLLRTGMVIFVYSLIFTSFISFAAVMIIPNAQQAAYKDNLINGLALHMIGPPVARLLLQVFVVAVGALILSGAVNTALIGSNGVLNRVAEDGVLDDWFRKPHARYGTSSRIINLVAGLQVAIILFSRGDVIVLGEAYAFGIVWSFTFMGVAMLMLRWKYKGERGWKVPLNFHVRGVEIPVGLGMIVLVLASTALVNLFTKKVATMAGLAFTGAFYAVFAFSEWHSAHKRRKMAINHEHKEKFTLEHKSEFPEELVQSREGEHRILVPVRDPGNLAHLRYALEESIGKDTQIIVMTIKVEKGDQAFEHVFTDQEEMLFTRVVEVAEKLGRTIVPIVVPSNNSWFAIARTAWELDAQEVLLGRSEKISPDVQLEQMAMMWAMVATGSGRQITFRIVHGPGREFTAVL